MSVKEYFKNKIECTLSPMDYLNGLKANPNGFILVDVRNAPAKIKKEKIKDSLEIQQIEIESNLDKLPKEKTIVVYCWETWCNLAAKSAIILINNGYKVKELSGGIAAWKTMGLETELI